VFGTRPEAVKMAMVARALGAADGVEHRICVTAQHREMLDSVLELFELHPEFDLDVMAPNQDITHVTCAVLTGMRDVLAEVRPDRVLVHGDPTTALGAALAAYYAKVPVGHVEAGLRTGDRYAPWPEEMNRRIADAISDRHYAPTEGARQNLLAEGVPDAGITVTGNTGIDALFHVAERLGSDAELAARARECLPRREAGRRLILVTAHRRENFDGGFDQICRALAAIGARDDVEIVFPVHPNPNVREPVRRHLSGRPHIHLIDPLDYLSFVAVMSDAHMIITDSGGIQEEAPALGKPLLLMRAVTERPEAVAAGTVRLVGTNTERIIAETERLLEDEDAYAAMARAANPFGDGHASERILAELTGG
jgi:UDP-N-acetylglucosamine 2-epimerase (non-hydrolysing)